MNFQLRAAPSGPVIRAQNDGDVMRWDAAQRLWVTAALPAPPAPPDVGFTYVISSRADLVEVVAPVGGEFVLPNGSYAIKGDIQLLSGEYLSVPTFGVVTMYGAGLTQIFGPNNSPDAVLRVRNFAIAVLRDLYLASDTAGQPGLRLDEGAGVQMFGGGVYNFAGDAVELLGSDCEFWPYGTYIYAERTAINHIAGVLYGFGANFNSGNAAGGACVSQSGAPNSKRAFISNSFFQITGQNPFLRQNSANGSLSIVNSEMILRAAATVTAGISMLLSRSLHLNTVLFYNQSGGTKAALSIAGNVQELNVSNCRCEALNSMGVYSSGVVNRAAFQGNGMDGGATFLNWPAANIPTNGLLLVGNQANTSAFFTGFSQASARVNAKANTLSGGLVPETAIVP